MDKKQPYNYEYQESEIDDDELQRQMEEEMAKLQHGGGDDDEFEKSSTYSMFNSSLANFNPSASVAKGGVKLTEDNMDAYVENLLQKEREKYRDANRDFLENNEALREIREMEQREVDALIQNEDWQRELLEIKEMNKVNLKEFVKEMPETASQAEISPQKVDFHSSLEMSDSKLMQEYRDLNDKSVNGVFKMQ